MMGRDFISGAKKVGRVSGLLALVLVCAPMMAQADDAEIKYPKDWWDPMILAEYAKGPGYLSKETVFEVTPHPTNAEAIKTEIPYLEEISKTERSDETIQLILKENRNILLVPFMDDGLFDSEKNPLAFQMLMKSDKDAAYFVLDLKQKIERARPSQLDPNLKLVIDNPGHAAYPSGHSTQSWLIARILSGLDPEHKDAYENESKAIAHRREIAGVHYPSDSAAGRELSDKIYEELQKNSDFKKDFEAAKAAFVASIADEKK